MKIAFITDDGKSISRHFGRASHYLVIEISEGQVLNREMRAKMGHSHFVKSDKDVDHTQGSGMDAASHRKHGEMAEAIQDCETLICGGMGRGAYQSMQSYGIKPFVTDKMDIDEALQAYLENKLVDQTEKLH